MLNKTTFKYSASIAVLLMGLGAGSAQAADVAFSDGNTLTGIGAVSGADTISYSDAGGATIGLTLDAVGAFTLVGPTSIDGDEGASASTNANVVNLTVGSGGGALDLTLSGNVIADGSTAGVAPDTINFIYSGSGSHSVTFDGAANDLGAGSAITFGNTADALDLNGDIRVDTINFSALDATLTIGNGVTLTGAIDNSAGSAGIVSVTQNAVITGDIGASSDVGDINVGSNGVLELQGTTLNVTDITLTGATSSTLQLTTDGTTLTSNVDSDANGNGIVDVNANVIFVGNMGTAGAQNGLSELSVATGKTLDLRGNVDADDVVLEGSATLLLNNAGLTVTSLNGIDGDTAFNGTVQASADATVTGDIGATNGISELIVDSASTLTFSGDTIGASNITLNDGTLQFVNTNTMTVTGDVDSGASQGALDVDFDTNFLGDIGAGASTLAAVDVADNVVASFLGTTFEVDAVTLEGANGAEIIFLTDGTTATTTIDSDFNNEGILDIQGSTTIVGNVGSSGSLADVQVSDTKTLTMQGDLTSQAINLDGGTLILNSAGMTVTSAQGIDGSAVNGGTLQVSANATFSGDLGRTNGVDVVIDPAATLTYTGNDVNATSIVVDNGFLQFAGANTTVVGTIDSLNGGEGTLDVNQNVDFADDIGSAQSLDELLVADNFTATLSGTTVSITDITLEGSNGATVAFDTDGTTFTGDINSDGNQAGDLDIQGNTTIVGNVGDLQDLDTVTVDNTKTLTLQGSLTALNLDLDGGSLVLDSAANVVTATIEGDATNGGSILASQNSTIVGDIGQTNPLTQIDVDNGVTLTLNGNVAANSLVLDGGSVDFISVGGSIASDIEGTVANGGTVDVSANTTFGGTVGATNAVTTVNVDDGITLSVTDNMTAGTFALDGGTLNVTTASTLVGNLTASVANGGTLDIDADTTFTGDIGDTNVLSSLDVDAAATLTLSGAGTLGASGASIAGTLVVSDTIELETGTAVAFSDGATISVGAGTVSGTSATTGNGVLLNADTNDATVAFSSGTTNILFQTGFTGAVDLVDASNGGTLNLNGTTFSLGNAGVLVEAYVDTTSYADVVTLVSQAKSAETLAADLSITDSQARSLIQASNVITSGNDSAARTALDNAIVAGGSTAATAAKQLALDVDSIDSSSEVSTASRMNFENVSTRLAAVRTGRAYSNTGLVGRTGIAAGNGVPDDKFWVRGFGQSVEQDERNGVDGYSAQAYGLTLGYDMPVSVDTRLGLAFGYTDTEVDGDGEGRSVTEIDSYQLTLYADYTPGNYYMEGQVGYSYNDSATSSVINFGGLDRTLAGEYETHQYSASFEAGYALPFSNTSRFVPYLGAQYYWVGGQTIELRGAGGLDQDVALNDVNTLLGALGARYEFELVSDIGTFSPTFHGGMLYDFIGDTSEASSRYVSGGAAYDIEGADVDQMSFNFGTGLTFITDDGLTEWSASYDAELKESYVSHTGIVKASFKF